MNPTLELYNRLQTLSAETDADTIVQVIRDAFPLLPEAVQSELLTKLYFMSLADDTIERIEIADLQRRFLETLNIIGGGGN